MKSYIVTLAFGFLLGIYVNRQIQNPPEKVIEYKDKIVTVTKTIRQPGGTITKEVVKTQDIIKTVPTTPPVRNNLLAFDVSYNGVYSATYGRKIFDNTFVTVGVDSHLGATVGVLVNF